MIIATSIYYAPDTVISCLHILNLRVFFFPLKTTECKSGFFSQIEYKLFFKERGGRKEKAQVNKTLKLFSFENKL